MLLSIADMVGLLGFVAIGIAMVVLGRLSARLGRVTNARPYFIGNYIGAICVWTSVIFRFYFITRVQSNFTASDDTLLYILLIDGLPALGITISLIVTWYYWSWLLAERD